MDRVRFITHGGRHVLLVDFSHASVEEALAAVAVCKQLVAEHAEHSLLGLTDVTGAHFDARVVAALKDLVVANGPHVRRAAVVGVNGLQRIIYDAVVRAGGRDLPEFPDRLHALDWLVAE